MAMVAAEAAGVAAESAGVSAGEGAAASADGAATGGAGRGSGQIGKAMGAAGAPTKPPGSGRRSAYRGKSTRQRVDQLNSDRRRVKSVTPKIRPLSFRDPRKIILAEFLVCLVIAGLRPFAKDDPKSATEGTFIQFSAIAALFFTLSLMTSGKKSGNVAAAFGGLVTLGVLFRNQAAFSELAKFFKAQQAAATDNTNSTTGEASGNTNSTTGDASGGDVITGMSSATDNTNSIVVGRRP